MERGMKCAVVTGATSGIGAAVCRSLLKENWRIYGIGRDFSKVPELTGEERFAAVECDLKRFTELEAAVRRIKADQKERQKREGTKEEQEGIQLLVNGAGVGYFGPHEELNPAKIHELTAVNLEAPMILASLFLRELKKTGGFIINISSVTAKKTNPHGCAYGAVKAGLTSFGESLFDEVRKYGVRVVNLHPDMTASDFYRNADFHEGSGEDTYLFPEETADCVMEILHLRRGAVITDMTIRPQRHSIVRKH